MLAVEDSQGNWLNLPRDSAGNLIRAHSPDGGSFGGNELDFEYDEKNRITRAWDRNSHHVDYSYGPNGRLVRVKELDGQVTAYSYDAKNRMITVRENGSLILSNEYDAGDRVIRRPCLTDALTRLSTGWIMPVKWLRRTRGIPLVSHGR